MTDAQLGLIVATASALGAAFVKFLHWAFTQWLANQKEEREQTRSDRRDDRASVAAVGAGVADIQLTLAAMLERDRVRDERAKRESVQPQNRRPPAPRHLIVPSENWEQDDGQTSNVVEIKAKMREELELAAAEREETERARTLKTPHGGTRIERPWSQSEGKK